MKSNLDKRRRLIALGIAGAVAVLAGCEGMRSMQSSMSTAASGGQQVTLSGSSEVPPVTTTASGTGTVNVKPDRTVTASITVTGMTPTAAHIHEAAAGANGPVILPFNKSGDMTFVAPDGAKLTEAQFASYKAGNLYVNVHSAKNPGGEVRAQLKGN
jgi:hypothetical protein